MDSSEIDGVLAYMAFRIVEHRRIELAETIALRLYRANGAVTADEVRTQLGSEWVEPDAQEIRDLVARKAQSSVDYHRREAADAAHASGRLVDKAERLAVNAAEAARAEVLEQPAADAAAAQLRAEDAQLVLAAAISAGGVPGNAPSGADAAAKAHVAEAVTEATGG